MHRKYEQFPSTKLYRVSWAQLVMPPPALKPHLGSCS
uniref:Uncharacterized protein MANES_15G160900 n=1 Tax=Rhizophora mucronata TaxID=61149 RepID=A0A2P2J723_RHIMU